MTDETSKTALTLEGMLDKTPDILKPIVTKYGPSLVAMTVQEFNDWLEMLIMGKDDEAWKVLLKKMSNADLLQAWKDKEKEWQAANVKNVARVDVQKQATLAVLKVLLTAAFAMVGL